MILKEFRDILKFTFIPFILLLILLLLSFFRTMFNLLFKLLFINIFKVVNTNTKNDFMVFFIFMFGVIIYLIASQYGFGSFSFEHKDSALEYILSFPVSRNRLIMNKIIPRMILLGSLILLYEILGIIYIIPIRSIQGKLFFLFDPVFVPVCVLFIFFASFFLGLFEQKNWVAIVNLLTFISWILVSLGFRKIISSTIPAISNKLYINGSGFTLGATMLLFILGISFFKIYKRFDAKSLNIHGKRFVLYVIPSLIILSMGSLIIIL